MLDEININAWEDITLTYSDGRMEKLEEHFRSPQHAIDIVKRLLHHSGMIIDSATPIAQGHLPKLYYRYSLHPSPRSVLDGSSPMY